MIIKLVLVPLTKKKMPEFWYIIPFAVFLAFYLKTGDWKLSLKMHMFIYGFFGFLLNRVLFCGHRIQEVWTEGAERIEDFGEHTMLATNDTDTWIRGFFSYLLLGGLNIHTPHHFFPTADLNCHGRILDIMERVCK